MVMLGTFILAFGWFGFNAGSSLAGGDGRIGIVATNTMLAGMSATVFGMLYMWIDHREARPVDDVQQHARGPGGHHLALRVRDAGGRVHHRRRRRRAGHLVSVNFFDKMKIDDPVGAISVHGVNGAWGLIAVGLFSDGSYGQGWNGVGATDYLGVAGRGVTGLFYGDSKQLVAQLIEVGRRHRLERRRGRRRLLVIGKLVRQPRVGGGRDRRARRAGDGRQGYPEFSPSAPEEVAAAGDRRQGRLRDCRRSTRNERLDGRASASNPSRPGTFA